MMYRQTLRQVALICYVYACAPFRDIAGNTQICSDIEKTAAARRCDGIARAVLADLAELKMPLAWWARWQLVRAPENGVVVALA
jgi:hypothetical protein